MKKNLLLIAAILLFVTCKKGNNVKPAPPLLDAVGIWTLYSWQQPGLNATVAVFPCLSENVLQVNADSTTYESYTGKDTCYTVLPTGQPPSWSAIGLPGQASISSTWSRNGNNIYIGGEHFVLSSSNGNLFLTNTTVITQGVTTPITIQVVDIKQ